MKELPSTNYYDETIKITAINFLSNTANLKSDEIKADFLNFFKEILFVFELFDFFSEFVDEYLIF